MDDNPLMVALGRLESAGGGLLGLGIPKCPASDLVAASLESVGEMRTDLTVAIVLLRTADDWALRETELWPRGIRVSRASVPVVARLADGEWTTRQGAKPASELLRWIDPDAGSAPEELTAAERQAIAETAARRGQHAEARSRGIGGQAE